MPPPSDRRSTPEPRIDDDELAGFEKSLLFVDDLTGLYNRRFLTHLFADRWDDLTGPSERLSLVIIDLDLFKDVNDTYGHLAGDHVLQEIGELLKQHFRRRDFVIRYGGDEFVIVLPGADRAEARTLARRTREAMAAHRFVVRETAEPIAVPLSFSLGAASYPEDGDNGEEVLAAADRRLYADKRQRQVGGPYRRFKTAALGAVLVAALVVGIFTLSRSPATPEDGSGGSEQVGTGATSSVEAEPREQILELQAELEAVPVEHPPTRDVYADYEARIRRLEARIVELQTELEQRPEPPPAPEGEGSAEVDSPRSDDRPTSESGTATRDDKPDSEAPPPSTLEDGDSAGSPAAGSPAAGSPAAGSPAAEIPAAEIPAAPADASPAIVRPSPISSVNARYPAAAVRLRREAVVLVQVLVDADGRARRAEVVGKRAGLGFDEAASTAALRAVYRPGTRDGEAVEMPTLVKVEFKLRD